MFEDLNLVLYSNYIALAIVPSWAEELAAHLGHPMEPPPSFAKFYSPHIL